MTYLEKLEEWYQTEKAAGRVLDIKFGPVLPEDRKGRTDEQWMEDRAEAVYKTLTGEYKSEPLDITTL